MLQTGGTFNDSNTVSASNDFSAPSSSSYAPIGNSVNYTAHFEWVSPTNEAPANFTILNSVALTGSVTARAVTGPTFTYGANASGSGIAYFGNAPAPSSADLHIYAQATAPNVDTGLLKDETPPARIYEVVSSYAFQGRQSNYLYNYLAVSGSVGATAQDPGSRATATGSLTNTTDISLPNYTGTNVR